jgi:hypothetical protein
LNTYNLIENYGRISLAESRAFEITYIAQPIRPAQDDWMLYQCLMNSISKEGKDKITIWKNQYIGEWLLLWKSSSKNHRSRKLP